MKPIEEILVTLYTECFRTGSSVICSPPVLTTDIDVMMHTKNVVSLYEYLLDNGWEPSKGDYSSDTGPVRCWHSFRKGEYNLLITDDLEYYSKFEEATIVATKLNLLNKTDRIYLFNYITQGDFE